jgi:hypothetical protein
MNEKVGESEKVFQLFKLPSRLPKNLSMKIPSALKKERLNYLHNNIRENVPDEFKDITHPHPDSFVEDNSFSLTLCSALIFILLYLTSFGCNNHRTFDYHHPKTLYSIFSAFFF